MFLKNQVSIHIPFFLILDLRFVQQRLKPGPNSDLFFTSAKSSSEFEVLICKKFWIQKAGAAYLPTYLLTSIPTYLPV
jgi:hypothetical protein